MTTIDPHVAGGGARAVTGDRTDGLLATVADWITSSDHKKIGRLFIGASLVVLVAVTAIGAILGFERIDAGASSIDVGALPQLFSLYRVLLTFGVVVPLGLGLALAVVPLQLGARSLAVPRLAAAGFWAWLFGAALVTISIIANGGPGGGDEDMVDLFLAGHVVLVAGLVAAAIAVATSVLTTRAPGMNMRRVPLFAWSALVGALGLVLALPVLAGALVLLYVDHKYARAAFGGNVGIVEWIGVAYTQPATILYTLPVFGLALETIATATRRRLPMRGVGLAGIGLVGTVFVAGVAQVQTGLRRNIVDADFDKVLKDGLPYALFHLVPLLGGVIVLLVTFLAVRNRPRPIAPLAFAVLALLVVLMGMVAAAVNDIGDAQLAGTVFEEGAWILLTYGTVLAVLGGVVCWGPKLWGRSIDDRKVFPLALLGGLAAVLAGVPYLVAGFAKQPAGASEFDYSGPQELWNTLSAVGHVLMLLTVLVFVALAIVSFSNGEPAGDDPWDGQTLEWATSSPAPADNFADVHIIASAEPLLDLKPARATTSEGAV